MGRQGQGGLYGVKPAFVARLRRVEDRLVAREVAPDHVTLAGAGFAGLTAAALVVGTVEPLVWLAVAPLSLARMACNALDGSLARRTQAGRPRGAVLNEVTDRGADLVTLAALAPVTGAALAATAACVALLVSFVAVLGEAVTGDRLTLGPMGKPDRVAVLSAGAAAGVVVGDVALLGAAWVIIAGGVATVVRRVHAIWRATEVAS